MPSIKSTYSETSIDEVIEKYSKMVYGIALTHLENKTDADDVFQDVFLTYYQKSKNFNEEDHRKAWIINTTLNFCKKTSGSSWRRKIVPLDDLPDQSESQTRYGFQFEIQEENLVFQALCELPIKYRLVLHLFYFEDMPVDVISRALKIRAGTVRMQLTRGRELIRSKLKGDYLYE